MTEPAQEAPTERIAKIEARVEGATSGVLFSSEVEHAEDFPCFKGEHWDIHRQEWLPFVKPGSTTELQARMVNVGCFTGSEADLRLFMHARRDLEFLLSRLRVLEADAKRLDWLDAALKNEPAWTDFVFAHDWEDGVWIARLERGSYNSTMALDNAGPLTDVRAAIDAAMSSASDTLPRAMSATPLANRATEL